MTHRRSLAVLLMITALAACSAPVAAPTASSPAPARTATPKPTPTPTPLEPLAIVSMRQRSYPGSAFTIAQTLPAAVNYDRYIASYMSDGLRINGLLTVPRGSRPAGGWPAIVFNHGYIPPTQYRTTERYVAYQDAFARAGYVTYKSDYRGHGSSEGQPSSAYGTPDYTVDVMNALSSVEQYPGVDRSRIGMWGHSMGGHLTLRSLVLTHDIKAAVIWAGVVAPYNDILYNWHPPPADQPPPSLRGTWRQDYLARFGTPQENPAFWDSISPNAYLADVTAPIQLDHGTADVEVPLSFSQNLAAQLQALGKPVELYTYPGADHNISSSLSLALQRSVAFFDRYLKS